ncbi:uncharacterized protein Tco025E_09242 [Trypanosoma conorhini]|uniref:Uncharacterized protein n=1 Tax=Trypanosoma conorhini TaxID=83891 RepID=A0A422MYU4_9TRYP|nr:uncharacterized protein Tco025E_09242 [Trypanosoma conorhini]RNE98398.1 hypothetical protein Tco025E_09242 [Trypanosoma conorhini]
MSSHEDSTRAVNGSPPHTVSAGRRSQLGHRPPKLSSGSLSGGARNANNPAVVVSLDNFERAPRVRGVLNSPRSLKACSMEEVAPAELLPRSVAEFMCLSVPHDLAQLRHAFFESRRNELLERVRRTRERLLAEEKSAGTPEITATEQAKSKEMAQEAAAAAKQPADGVNDTHHASMCMSNHHGRTSRSSSTPWRHGFSLSRHSFSPFARSTAHRPESRSTSVGAMMIYSRALSEHRPPTERELVMLERIDEREQRTAEARQRVELEEQHREHELILQQLKKLKQTMNNIVEKENKRNALINARRIKREEQMLRARERQRREDEARRFQRETRGSRTSTLPANDVSRTSLLGGPRKGRRSSSTFKASPWLIL